MDLSVRELAARQLADYRAGTPGTFFAEENQPHLSLDDAYVVQGEVAGYKVGCTGPGVREQFGMDGPVRGFLYGTELYLSGAELSYASLTTSERTSGGTDRAAETSLWSRAVIEFRGLGPLRRDSRTSPCRGSA